MLELKNITKIFNAGTVNEKVALDDLSITLEDGDFVMSSAETEQENLPCSMPLQEHFLWMRVIL